MISPLAKVRRCRWEATSSSSSGLRQAKIERRERSSVSGVVSLSWGAIIVCVSSGHDSTYENRLLLRDEERPRRYRDGENMPFPGSGGYRPEDRSRRSEEPAATLR